MSKKSKSVTNELDDEFFAQLDFLRADYDSTTTELEQAQKDVRKLIALLVEKDIPVPSDMLDRYIRRAAEDGEESPFN